MSIHIEPTRDAREALRRQHRRSTLGSLTISMLVMALLALILAIILIDPFSSEEVEVVAYSQPAAEAIATPRPTVRLPQAAPSAPAANISKVLAAATASPVSIPVPELPVDLPSMDFGDALDFGAGWDGGGGGAGSGSSSGFGSSTAIVGGLRGRLYDFKQDNQGRPVNINLDFGNPGPYADRVVAIQKARFADSAFSKIFKAPQELSLTQVAIAKTPATEGPKFFNAEKDIQPRGWLAHYSGRIASPRNITFRFVGAGDDYLAVFIDGNRRLDGSWPEVHNITRERWSPAKFGSYPSSIGNDLIAGDWITLRTGQEVQLDLALGERPGGQVGFILLVEEKGVSYKTAANGRPILPLFATQPFSPEARTEITASFGDFPIEWENVPIFPAR